MALMVEGDARVNMERVIKNCDVYRAEIMGVLEIEESDGSVDENESLDNQEFDLEDGYL